MNIRIIILSIIFLSADLIYGQDILGKYILSLEDGSARQLEKKMHDDISRKDIHFKVLSEQLDLAYVEIADHEIEKFASNHPQIRSYTKDQKLQLRNNPNDPQYISQWNLKTIKTPRIWEITTGGKNTKGDDIVVAVLDLGFDNSHEDLQGSIWQNQGEIPNDGIDNDNNGYVDDYNGLNISTGNDVHKFHDHGLGVAGIIGARGNNDIGISGINWDVKILTISEAIRQSAIIEAYQYIYDLRKKYNDTDGAEGAYIVATNLSAGIPDAFWNEGINRNWCEMYDLLGSVGIISCGATDNRNVNVDKVGDMPSTCPSDYFICVTNTTREDELYKRAAIGPVNVDIAAPGSGSTSLHPNNEYDSFNGTSGATPHVAGAIALLHALPCEQLTTNSIENPSVHALEIRAAILDGVNELNTLSGKISTGGRLNILGAAQELGATCPEVGIPSDRGPLKILDYTIYDDQYLRIEYLSPDEDDDYVFMLSDAMGRKLRYLPFTPTATGVKRIIVDIPHIPTGIYIMTIFNVGSMHSIPFFHHEY